MTASVGQEVVVAAGGRWDLLKAPGGPVLSCPAELTGL